MTNTNMPIRPAKRTRRLPRGVILLGLFVFSAACVFGQEQKSDTFLSYEDTAKGRLSFLQQQARDYRAQGLVYQRLGKIEEAMTMYQKAVEMDPSYAVALNDLGVTYELTGQKERAEEVYLQAVNIDPDFASTYSNLASLYEERQDLEQAALYWEKRIELGSGNDAWTQKAIAHLDELNLMLGKPSRTEVKSFAKEIAAQRLLVQKDAKELAKVYLEKAKTSYNRGEDVAALKEASDAMALDSSNSEIIEFVERVQKKLLVR